MPKRIMREFRINEISAVDAPAQQGATVVLMKRNDASKGDAAGLHKNPADTTVETQEATAMSDDTKKADERITELQAKLAAAEAVAEMTDAQKAHHKSLSADEAKAYLAKSNDERQRIAEAAVAKANEANGVVYTAADGTEYRKSDDPKLVQLAKDRDADRKELAKERAERENERLEKRADAEFNHLGGERPVRAAIVKALEGIDDQHRDDAIRIVKAHNDKLAPLFKTAGVATQKSESTGQSASDELDELAKARAEKDGITEAEAYQKVLETEDGQRLYAQHRAEKSQAVRSVA